MRTAIDALRLNLIGPTPDDATHAAETIPPAPSSWYLSGFLVPYEAKLSDRSDPDSNDSFDPQITKPASGDDEKAPEAASARKGHFPSSLGLSFLFTPAAEQIEVAVLAIAQQRKRQTRLRLHFSSADHRHRRNRLCPSPRSSQPSPRR